MRKIAIFGCLAGLAVVGGTVAAKACDDVEYRATRGYSYSYAPAYVPRTYGYTSRRWAYGYAPASYYDDDDFYYGYGPSVGVGIYGDFDRRGGRRFRYRDGDRADRFQRGDRFTQRSATSRAVTTGSSEIRRGGTISGGGPMGGSAGGKGPVGPGR